MLGHVYFLVTLGREVLLAIETKDTPKCPAEHGTAQQRAVLLAVSLVLRALFVKGGGNRHECKLEGLVKRWLLIVTLRRWWAVRTPSAAMQRPPWERVWWSRPEEMAHL
jgi:hypothetical protein